jgi:hypothetical protein
LLEVDTDLIEARDVACLAAADVIALDRHQSSPDVPVYMWTNLRERPERFRQELAGLGPAQGDTILRVWEDARAELARDDGGALSWLRGLGLAGVPAASIVLGVCVRRVRQDSVFTLAALFYLCFLVPYVLISHYARYQMFVLGIQALLLPFGLTVASWPVCRMLGRHA